MRGEWAYYKNKYSKEQCDFITNVAKSRPANDAQMGVDGKSQLSNYRKSKVRWVYPGDNQLAFLFTDIWQMAMETNNQFFDFQLSKMDYLQIAEYDGDQRGEYKKHQDVFWMNNDPKYHRKLSVIIQLSDPTEYDNGDFQFYNVQEHPKAEDIRAQGTVIFFPSFIDHAALPVTLGMRYSIAGWIDGPKWR